jgi:hypothetical protein
LTIVDYSRKENTMATNQDLREVEKRIFRSAVDDGLWDVLLAALVSMFAIAPLLSTRLGDFLSSAVFVPILAAVYAVVLYLRKRIVAPRIGVVHFGKARQARLKLFTILMLTANVIFFVVGLVAASSVPGRGWSVPIGFSIVVLGFLSTAAYFLDLPRLYAYGLMLAAAPLVGEWLWRGGYASHHGFPVTFGTVATVIAITGLIHFVSLVQRRAPDEKQAAEGSHNA